jgi:hypothetical protein
LLQQGNFTDSEFVMSYRISYIVIE